MRNTLSLFIYCDNFDPSSRPRVCAGLLSFTHVKPNDCEALRRAFESAAFTGNEIAGLIMEPVLGEGGIHMLTDEYMRLARQLCDEAGACLIFDEVQV
jgi:putrescine aminotransferase